MRSEGRFKGSFRAAALVAVLASGAIAAGCSSGSSGTAADTSVEPDVATWAEAPQTPPNYIFPFMSLAFFSVSNSEQFQYLMYRPALLVRQGCHAGPEPVAVPGPDSRPTRPTPRR